MLIEASIRVGRKTYRATGRDRATAYEALLAKLRAFNVTYLGGVTFEEV